MAGNRFRKPGWLTRPRVRFLHPPPSSCIGCGDGGPRRVVAPDSPKRALEVRILPATPDRAGVIATGRHTRLKPELVVVRVHPPVPSARVAQWADAVGFKPDFVEIRRPVNLGAGTKCQVLR